VCPAWEKLEMPVQTPKGKMAVTLLEARVLQGAAVVEDIFFLRHGACSMLRGGAEPWMYILFGPPRFLLHLLLVLCAVTILISPKPLLRR